MPSVAIDSLIDSLRDSDLLTAGQLAELTGPLQANCPDPDALASQLVERGWITQYQAEHLAHGRGKELVLGPYILLQPLGRGGMGEVFKARHKLMNRVVALKVIRPDRLADEQAVTRFHREIQAVARLSHPNIVTAHDAAQVGDTHFFVMEYVEGTDLAHLVQQHGPLPATQAADFARQAALALQHAHEQGLVHRDVKPANLLVTAKDSTVKLLDLGLVRLLHDTQQNSGDVTADGAVIGTPDYMAPDQSFDSHRADIRSDIYSLGCTLYHLLSGKPPFPGGSLVQKLLKHREIDPVPIEGLRPDVPRGLGDVVCKMMAKRPEDRYQTPAETAAALAPFTVSDGKPATQTPSMARLPLPTFTDEDTQPSAMAVSDTSISAVVPASSIDGISAPSPATIAEANATLPAARRGRRVLPWAVALLFLAGISVWAGTVIIRIRHPSGKETTISTEEGSDVKVGAAGNVTITLPPQDEKPGTIPQPILDLDELKREDVPERELKLAGFGDASQAPKELVGVIGDSRFMYPGVVKVAYSLNGTLVASLSRDGVAVVWHAETGKPVRRITIPGPSGWEQMHDVGFSADGKYLVTNNSRSASPVVWDLATGEIVRSFSEGPSRSMALSRDGKYIAYSPYVDILRLAEFETGEITFERNTQQGHLGCMAFSRDGTKLATAGGSKRRPTAVKVWDVSSSQELHVLAYPSEQGSPVGLAFSPDGRFLASCSIKDATIHVWNVESGELLKSLPGPAAYMRAVAFSPDGKFLAGCGNNMMRLWSTSDWQIRDYPQNGFVADLAFSPDGDRIAFVELAGIGFLETTTGRRVAGPVNPGTIVDAHVSAAGDLMLAGWDRYRSSGEQDLVVWRNGISPSPHLRKQLKPGPIWACATRVAAVSDGRLRVWNSDTGRELLALPWDYSAHKAAFDPRGRYVAIGQVNGTVEAFDLESGKKIGSGRKHPATVAHLLITDEAIVVSAATNGTIKAWDAALDQELYEIEHRPAVSMSASRDGKCLSIAFQQPAAPEKQPNEVRVYNLHTGELIQSFQPDFVPHETGLNHDGSLVAAAAQDGRLAVWHVASQERLYDWKLPFLSRPVFAPDGRHLLTINGNGTAYVFRLGPLDSQPTATNSLPEELPKVGAWPPGSDENVLPGLVPRPARLPEIGRWQLDTKSPRPSTRSAWSPDGNWIAAAGLDGYLRIWDAATGALRLAKQACSKEVVYLDWRPDSTQIATAGWDGMVRIWNAPDGTQAAEIAATQKPGAYKPWSVAWSPDGRRVATGSNESVIRIWDTVEQRMVGVFESGLDTVVDIDWSADGRWLAGAWTDFRTHRNAKTHLWSMPDGALVREFDTPFFAWSPQQAQIALGSAHGTNDLTIWDMETGQSRTIYHKVTAARTNFPAWSPDGARIATGLGHRRFGRVWLWPVTGEAGELAFNPADLTVGTLAITWSHDARQLVMSGWNGVVRVFDAQTGEPRWLAIALVNGETVSLTAAGEVLNASPGALAELVYSVEKPDGAIESLSPAEFQARIAPNSVGQN